MNTGLALRKPLESSQGAAHRFLVANAALPKAALLRRLNAFSLPHEFHPPGYYAVLAQRWEQQFCQTYRLPYYAPEPVPLSMALRNCPWCSALGYHSRVYQWAWLTQCPVHRLPLTDKCPECHASWPSVVELLQRDCRGCGWPIHRHQLHSLQAFSTPWSGMEAFRVIQREYQSLAKARLTALVNSPHAADEHQSITVEHRDFASVYTRQFPGHHVQLLEKQASVQPVSCFRFPLPAENPDQGRRQEPFDLLVSGWRRQVEAQILKAIERYRQCPLAIPRFYHMEYEGLDADTDCVRLAFTYWRKLVETRAGRAPPHSRYFDQGAGSYPLIPVPMARLALTSGSDQESGFLLTSGFTAPLELTRKVYELDLWWCFRSLRTYFEVLKTHRDSINPTTLSRTLPSWAWPGRPYNEAMGSLSISNSTWS